MSQFTNKTNTPTGAEIRQAYLDFFRSKGHEIVPSAPVVIKNDPTLLFTNAGMNQFKDYFLGNKPAPYPRVADTQKCLRVSGKHNDLEEVGVDTYHHTLFEMLGNWSFGNYFKPEAIAWSWELLTEVYGINKDRLYVTIFQGDEKENLPKDNEANDEWKKWIAEDRILLGNKKDNFWEMGDTGPCGPCSEIHVDCRPDEERQQVDGATLVNNDHPQVIEIWNNVFMQFNRLKDGSLQPLPAKHVDTGMGLERLVRVLQGKTSNYDTDLFTGTIGEIEKLTGQKYDYSDSKQAIAFRVLSDHIRAISFTIADGQLPSNTGAGYVIRRILRRAVRYYYSYFERLQPLLHLLVPVIAKQFQNVFPELQEQVAFVSKVVFEEENSFLRTLDKGLDLFHKHLRDIQEAEKRFSKFLSKNDIDFDSNAVLSSPLGNKEIDFFLPKQKLYIEVTSSQNALRKSLENINSDNLFIYYADRQIGVLLLNQNNELERKLGIEKLDFGPISTLDGKIAFDLFDTYGFPIDLTNLLASELNWKVDMKGFEEELQKQKTRSRAATAIDAGDWVILEDEPVKFVGYDSLETKTHVLKYRKVNTKGKDAYQLVLATTPFYAESGGQVGDTGVLEIGGEDLPIVNTKKEGDLIIQFADELPEHIDGEVVAKVDVVKRQHTSVHHSATHLLHAALRKVLGTHVAQKGSLVNADYLRFDFSHFAKMTDEEISQVETIVNEKIRENVPVVITELPKEEALKLGAMALFGEKYGDMVRVVVMDPNYSVELCGGTHVGHTGELGFFKIKSEAAVAAGVRRIEAVAGVAAEAYVQQQLHELQAAKLLLKNPKEFAKAIESLQTENASLKKEAEKLEAKALNALANELIQQQENVNETAFIGKVVEVSNGNALKDLCLKLHPQLMAPYAVALAANIGGKASVAIMYSEALVQAKGLDAVKTIKEKITPIIKGGGGGKNTLATAGGQDVSNLPAVIEAVKGLL